ncbi:EF-hand calcium-binding domain containing protein 1 [Dissostichus eleginoides]|uniref:EF-hand calcium-binding domain containing protein 1 n=1 Tax=Dissostichus eleginoides TaxID=100907 RepID=A0AAD9BAJ2_DISEL|nr:EF-hand calcium-binding domain containing protein 1 [Dissostichus eleginoides]
MSEMQLLRLFISERLSVAAEEIFSAVQRTISEQRSQQDGDHRHGLKPEVQSLSGETPHGFISAYVQTHHETDWSPKSCHNNPSVKQEECGLLVPDPPAIKQEEPWSSPEGEQLPDMEDTSTLKKVNTAAVGAVVLLLSGVHTQNLSEMSAMNRKVIQTLAETISKHAEHFNKTEVEFLIREFNVLLGEQTVSGRAVPGLDRGKFRSILHNIFGMTDDMIMDGVFRTFDKDNDSFVSMKEWVEGLSVFLRGTLEEQIKYCFHVYDLNGDN